MSCTPQDDYQPHYENGTVQQRRPEGCHETGAYHETQPKYKNNTKQIGTQRQFLRLCEEYFVKQVFPPEKLKF